MCDEMYHYHISFLSSNMIIWFFLFNFFHPIRTYTLCFLRPQIIYLFIYCQITTVSRQSLNPQCILTTITNKSYRKSNHLHADSCFRVNNVAYVLHDGCTDTHACCVSRDLTSLVVRLHTIQTIDLEKYNDR